MEPDAQPTQEQPKVRQVVTASWTVVARFSPVQSLWMVDTKSGKRNLTAILSDVEHCGGTIIPLGIGHDDTMGQKGLVCTVFISVPGDSPVVEKYFII